MQGVHSVVYPSSDQIYGYTLVQKLYCFPLISDSFSSGRTCKKQEKTGRRSRRKSCQSVLDPLCFLVISYVYKRRKRASGEYMWFTHPTAYCQVSSKSLLLYDPRSSLSNIISVSELYTRFKVLFSVSRHVPQRS